MVKKIGKSILILLLALLLLIGGYVLYVVLDYHRLEDNLEVEVTDTQTDIVETDVEYDLLSFNIGFGAYERDFGFFMDGGTESWAWSEERLDKNLSQISQLLLEKDADFYCLQEVDRDSTRSYHVDEYAYIMDVLFGAWDSSWTQNYDSPFLFYPIFQPHGKSVSGLATLSGYHVDSVLRRSLPVEKGFMKFLDLDRCYSVSHIPMDNCKELVLYNAHLSAYSSDGSIATEQLVLLLEDMQQEAEKGNYVICAGDFNKDLLGDSSQYFGVSGEEFTWAQSFPFEMIPEELELVVPFDEEDSLPTCRNADGPYDPEKSFVLTIDGFIVSDNVEVNHVGVVDTQFAYSDHNPVEMTFVLKGEE